MITTIKKIKDKVLYILEKSKKSRDDDILLYFLYLNKFHDLSKKIGRSNVKILYSILKTAPYPESIRRSRQKLQEKGIFLGKRRKKRVELEKEVRAEINKIY